MLFWGGHKIRPVQSFETVTVVKNYTNGIDLTLSIDLWRQSWIHDPQSSPAALGYITTQTQV